MPGLYSSRATKFAYLDGAEMTGPDGPLTKSESETELLTEKFSPEGSARPVVVQSGLSNEMISLEGYARRDSGAANLILSDDAHDLSATPERVLTIADFGDIVGQRATVYRAVSLAEAWKVIPGDILLQFSGTLKTARGANADVGEGRIIRAMAQSVGANDTGATAIRGATCRPRLGLIKRLRHWLPRRADRVQGPRELDVGNIACDRDERHARGDCRFKRRHPHHGCECHPRPARLLAHEGRHGP